MYVLRRTGQERSTNIWPGFVDGLATLLLVVIFVLMVFVVAQFYLSAALTGRDAELTRLNRQILQLTELLSLEQDANADLRSELSELSSQLRASLAQREDLKRDLENAETDVRVMADTLIQMETELEESARRIEVSEEELRAKLQELEILRSLNRDLERDLKQTQDFAVTQEEERAAALLARENALGERDDALRERDSALNDRDAALAARVEAIAANEEATRQIALLNQQILAMRQQLAALQEALEASEAANEAANVQIAELGERLNAALASKVQELARYRSEFFGRLREVLGENPNVRIVGDRFVFQSEVLFAQGEATLGAEGQVQLAQFAETLREITTQIPGDIDWILRVDGHTDSVPIQTARFPSNWELSAARAISVVKFLIGEGIPADRMVAAGFGEFQPLAGGESAEALSRNRRIEMKLDQR